MYLFFLPFALVIAAIVGVLVLFASTGAWPLLLIAAGLWLLARESNRRVTPYAEARGWQGRPARRSGASERSAAPGPAPKAAEPRPDLPPSRGPELPSDLREKAERIRKKAEALQARGDGFPPYSPDLYLVRQTTADYLPRTVMAYLSLPDGTADQPVDGSGKTAHQELAEQLDLLETKLDDIAEHLHQRDLDPLMANRRFLEERFSRSAEAEPPEAAA